MWMSETKSSRDGQRQYRMSDLTGIGLRHQAVDQPPRLILHACKSPEWPVRIPPNGSQPLAELHQMLAEPLVPGIALGSLVPDQVHRELRNAQRHGM